MKKLSQTKLAKKMRAMRRNETPFQRKNRLYHRRMMFRAWSVLYPNGPKPKSKLSDLDREAIAYRKKVIKK